MKQPYLNELFVSNFYISNQIGTLNFLNIFVLAKNKTLDIKTTN